MQELFRKLKELNLQKEKYAIFGSGPIGIRGLREIRDLDVIITEDYFNELLNAGGWELKKEEFCDYLEKNGIELYREWGPGEWDINKLIQEAETIDGLPFVKLEEVLKWKKLRGRDKDEKDIELIENYFKKYL
jgi:flavodoxin